MKINLFLRDALIVTDLSPKQGNALWYGLRSWIESSYRDVKSDGWQWHKTRLREPARAERLWLAMAVATLWTVTVGSDDHQHLSEMLDNQAISPDEENPSSELTTFCPSNFAQFGTVFFPVSGITE